MARMSGNDECPSGDFGDSSQLTNRILDYGATCNMTPEVYNFIPGLLEDTDKNIEFADGNHVTEKQKGQVRIKGLAITETFLSQCYTTYFWHQMYVTGYFQLLC